MSKLLSRGLGKYFLQMIFDDVKCEVRSCFLTLDNDGNDSLDNERYRPS